MDKAQMRRFLEIVETSTLAWRPPGALVSAGVLGS